MAFDDTNVMLALETEGLSYGDKAKRPAYARAIHPFDTAADAVQMASTQSACLLHARAILATQQDGDGAWCLPGEVTLHGRRVDALRTPYARTLGQIETLLTEWGRQHRYLTPNFHRGDAVPDIRPGDLVMVGQGGSPPKDPTARQRWLAEWGGVAHGFVVVGTGGDAVMSVDGGQDDFANLDDKKRPRPTAIRARTRTLVRKANGWWLGDRRLAWRIRVV
jgi:hypothetical protein